MKIDWKDVIPTARTWALEHFHPWIWTYRWQYLLADLFAGLTVSTMAVPQGMAYALLAELPPETGLYTTLFPVLIFTIFGSTPVISTGPFAITSILLGSLLAGFPETDRLTIAAAVTFWCGLMQVVGAALRFGTLAERYLLAPPVTSGFVAASAIHIITSQIFPMLRLSKGDTGRQSYSSWLPELWKKIAEGIFGGNAHWPSFGVGLVTIVVVVMLDYAQSHVRATCTGSTNEPKASQCQAPIGEELMLKDYHQTPAQDSPSLSPLAPPSGSPSMSPLRSHSFRLGQTNPSNISPEIPTGIEALTSSRSKNSLSHRIKRIGANLNIPTLFLSLLTVTLVVHVASLKDLWGIQLIPEIPQGFPEPSLSLPFSFLAMESLPSLLPSTFILATVSALLTFSISKSMAPSVTESESRSTVDSQQVSQSSDSDSAIPSTTSVPKLAVSLNQDVFALGLSSAIGAFFNAFVSAGSLTRSAALFAAGGRSPVAMLSSVAMVALSLSLLTDLFSLIPRAAIAGIVLHACWSLCRRIAQGFQALASATIVGMQRFKVFTRCARGVSSQTCCDSTISQLYWSFGETFTWWSTFLVGVFMDIQTGIAVGIGLNLIAQFHSFGQDWRSSRRDRQ